MFPKRRRFECLDVKSVSLVSFLLVLLAAVCCASHSLPLQVCVLSAEIWLPTVICSIDQQLVIKNPNVRFILVRTTNLLHLPLPIRCSISGRLSESFATSLFESVTLFLSDTLARCVSASDSFSFVHSL